MRKKETCLYYTPCHHNQWCPSVRQNNSTATNYIAYLSHQKWNNRKLHETRLEFWDSCAVFCLLYQQLCSQTRNQAEIYTRILCTQTKYAHLHFKWKHMPTVLYRLHEMFMREAWSANSPQIVCIALCLRTHYILAAHWIQSKHKSE